MENNLPNNNTLYRGIWYQLFSFHLQNSKIYRWKQLLLRAENTYIVFSSSVSVSARTHTCPRLTVLFSPHSTALVLTEAIETKVSVGAALSFSIARTCGTVIPIDTSRTDIPLRFYDDGTSATRVLNYESVFPGKYLWNWADVPEASFMSYKNDVLQMPWKPCTKPCTFSYRTVVYVDHVIAFSTDKLFPKASWTIQPTFACIPKGV